mmetsp:Transcript_21646/g.45708  ORF Transcript_21646/g.45708 Transcript_21646/m.45708 type:complete len:209 (-) Transcript_21646:604-1230(-)|eukprot:CAMPEP_0201133212 /NCGR_PEP_ID=MMETSP0850-20130426/48129_1 /ASSEMBLY_ACC=CAM_ASM_000622 /TAXON_ID=183588 /ORGANISM="Pseudo-nitzschia fraudulenta, Strain WWA7" /LENGTH=208 /DNA_ID=CAMNT_0047403783 /DNA_START=171 /DNA_END=797 /DNA_ORIENTATION=+
MVPSIRKERLFIAMAISLVFTISHVYAYSIPKVSRTPKVTYRSAESAVTSMSMSNEDIPDPVTFREAEVLGLRLMQEGRFDEALIAFQKGMKLPGSRPDVIRSRSVSGPSPVGGSFGGTDSQKVMTLDDFELQAVYYNMACANSRLGNISDSVVNLEKAFQNGFDNYSTVRGDPDLDPIKQSRDYEKLMDTYDGKGGGFNPFGLFSKN